MCDLKRIILVGSTLAEHGYDFFLQANKIFFLFISKKKGGPPDECFFSSQSTMIKPYIIE